MDRGEWVNSRRSAGRGFTDTQRAGRTIGERPRRTRSLGRVRARAGAPSGSSAAMYMLVSYRGRRGDFVTQLRVTFRRPGSALDIITVCATRSTVIFTVKIAQPPACAHRTPSCTNTLYSPPSRSVRHATVASPFASPRPHPSCAYLPVSTPRKHPSPDAPVRRVA